MTLTSTSTLDDAIDQAMDNLVWEGSVAKAEAYLEACRAIVILRGQQITTNNRTVNFEALLAEVNAASDYVSKFGTNADETPFVTGRMRR